MSTAIQNNKSYALKLPNVTNPFLAHCDSLTQKVKPKSEISTTKVSRFPSGREILVVFELSQLTLSLGLL